MDIRIYRAATMQEALALVRRELGPSAAVLHTREVRGNRLLSWIPGVRQIEVTASSQVNVPSRLPPSNPSADSQGAAPLEWEGRAIFRNELKGRLDQLHSLVEDLCRRSRHQPQHEWSDSLFRLYTDLIDAEIGDDLARELVERLRRELPNDDLGDTLLAKARIARWIEDEIDVAGPIVLTPGRRRLIALVGPTGVGKTTTIAKLAANFRLRDKRKVGLITVDTYRIAAVEQLRTYADIIELPMRVVSTPQEMRAAVDTMADMDLVMLDTAGRSPKDELQLQELRQFVTAAGADEVHLVLSSVASAGTLARTAERFAEVGTSALILTKLDEANALGNLLPLVRSCRLPLSYLTNGQNVPDDIAPADRRTLARFVLGMEG
ncbi:MAG TPA: flagellar biosynthesis protein FlhF [Pirellulales bacterium]|jgi:flagellar biosynthesis protein FlhF|nr:flagellar biosynthesis protein FlhF [Pirellulales bacterium]